MHNLDSPFNISSVRPLNNPKHCEKHYVADSNYYSFAFALKWNLADPYEVVSRFYKDGNVPSLVRALYLIEALDGNKAAYDFAMREGRLESVQIGDISDPELLLLLIKIFGREKAWSQFRFALDTLCNGSGRSMPRGLGNPDLYVHASLNAEIASHLVADGATPEQVGTLKDTVIVDLKDGRVIFSDCFKRPIIPATKTPPVIVAMMRVRNEATTIRYAIESIASHVDHVVVFDDHSNDGTVEVIKGCADRGLPIDLIPGEAWLFNESLIHQFLVSRGRELGGTHFIQVDADEILSDDITPQILRDIMSAMRPGDILALPWLNLTTDMSAYYSEDRIVGLPPSRGIKRFKDVAFADDGFSQFPEWQYAHVNVAPFTYARRFLSLNDGLSLFHLEQINLVNWVAKKDWYRLRAYHQNKRLPGDPYLDIRLHMLQMAGSTVVLPTPSKHKDEVQQLFGSLAELRITSNCKACEMYPQVRPFMYVDYAHFDAGAINNLSEKK